MLERYMKYSRKTQEWMDNLLTTLSKQCEGNIPDSYFVTLDLIADSVELYFDALQRVKNDGIVIKGGRGDKVKHPAISVINNCQTFIQRMLSASGLTALSAAKLNKADLSQPNDLDDFIDD
jgi:phage terminase small subunit